MRQLRVLITCEELDGRRGTELYVRDVAQALLRIGHTPFIYTNKPGEVAVEIRNLTIPVVNRLAALTNAPDVIFGQHHLPTMMALLNFPDVPGIYVCHDWYWQSAFAPRFPRILKFIAVDVPCRDRLIFEDGIEESRVVLFPNSVDLSRFQQRSPLPAHPQRALVFSNYTDENAHLVALREACSTAGIQLHVVGELMNNAVASPEDLLKNYDIVFAKGRAALEALAAGCAVIIYSGIRFLGPMVRAKDVDALLPLNLGIRAMGNALTPDELTQRVKTELARYDPLDAAEATANVRSQASQTVAMQAVADLCEEVVDEYAQTRSSFDPRLEGPAAAAYLERLQKQHAQWTAEHQKILNSTAARFNASLRRFPRLSDALRPYARMFVRRR